MLYKYGSLICAILLSQACHSHRDVNAEVRAFAQTVEHDVTKEGPTAWRRHFADTPSFFMAVEGSMAFPDSAAATKGIEDFARTNRHIELAWGNDLRVDPLTPDLAVMAASYREIQEDIKGNRVEEKGYFTGTAEYREGRWQFRNAHWSAPVPRAAH